MVRAANAVATESQLQAGSLPWGAEPQEHLLFKTVESRTEFGQNQTGIFIGRPLAGCLKSKEHQSSKASRT